MIRPILMVLLGAAVSLPAQSDESWSGIVKKEPQGDYTHWFIGDSQLSMDEDTRIKIRVGRLEVGACTDVDSDGEAIRKVTTRPMRKCDHTDYEAYFASFKALGEQGS